MGALSSAGWGIRDPLASGTPVEAAHSDPPRASGLGPRPGKQCLHLSRGRRREEEEARAVPQTSPQLPRGSGRDRAAGRWKPRGRASRQRPGSEQLALPRPGCPVPREGALRAPPAACPHPAPKPAGPHSRPLLRGQQAGAGGAARGSRQGARPRPRTVPPRPARLGEAERQRFTWLVWGGRDGHGSGARGGTGSPGTDRLLRRRAGASGRLAVRSPVTAAAPWTPTRSFSAAAGPPSHYPPPSSAAAASSAETPRPLHTRSHHAAGEPLPPTRHFRAQVARSGPGAGGCWGGRYSRGISVTERLPPRRRRGAERPPPFWVRASLPFPLTSLRVTELWARRPPVLGCLRRLRLRPGVRNRSQVFEISDQLRTELRL